MKISTIAITSALAMMAGSLTARADQWGSSVSNLLLCDRTSVGQDLPLAASAPDGGAYASWLSWEDATACLKVQHLSADGNSLLEEGGKYVSRYETPTWSSGYDLDSDAEGNAIIVYSDMRNGAWQAYAYKMSPAGEMLWGADGVAISNKPAEACLNPQICVTDKDNILIGYQALEGKRNSIKIAKLKDDGSMSWGGLIEVTGANGLYRLVPADGDSFYLVWLQSETGSLAVMRFTAAGDEAWDEPTIVDEGRAVVSAEPEVAPDGKGGVLVGWRHAPDMMTQEGALQGVDRNGKLLWADHEIFGGIPRMAADKEGNFVVACTLGKEGRDNFTVSRYNSDGQLVWQTEDLLKQQAYLVSIYGVSLFGQDTAVVYRNAWDYNIAFVEYAHIDADGNAVVTEGEISSMDGDKGRGDIAVTGPTSMVAVWGDNGMAKGGGKVYASKVVLTPTSGVETVTEKESGLFTEYDGDKLTVAAPGLEGETVEVFAVDGRKVTVATVQDGKAILEMPSAGVYIVKAGADSLKVRL